MHDAMEDTVKRGTARRIYTKDYRIAGKTGTAQVKSIAQGKSYDKSALDKRHWDHAWFTGFAPVENPSIALAVLVENGGGGSTVAAPIGRELFDYWVVQRDKDPILPPTPDQLKIIKRHKALEKARLDAIREAEAKAAAEALEEEALSTAATSTP
jgi:penicillin-binding protein 2